MIAFSNGHVYHVLCASVTSNYMYCTCCKVRLVTSVFHNLTLIARAVKLDMDFHDINDNRMITRAYALRKCVVTAHAYLCA